MKNRRRIIIVVCVIVVAICGSLGVLLFAYGDKSDSKIVTIYFVRHGQTDGNVQGLLWGQEGTPQLTSWGIDMSIERGNNLASDGVRFTNAYSSPAIRAQDTARYILQGMGVDKLTVVTLDNLKDISWGDAEGTPATELQTRFDISGTSEAFGQIDDKSFKSPINAESKYNYVVRFNKAVDEIIDNVNNNAVVLVVSHSSMQFYFSSIIGDKAGDISNVGVVIVRYVNGQPFVISYNGNVMNY